jgi:hypothetical protein
MESGIQSSFIPHDAGEPSRTQAQPPARSSLAELGLLVSIVLLVASGALAGAVFLYKQYAQTSEASKVQQLQRAKDAFEPSLIQELTRLDDRMRAADQVLASHIAPSALFNALQQATLATVSFQTLDFLATDPQRMTIKVSGIAEGVNSIALQADLFSKNGVITNPIFSDISRQPDGVHFSLSALINPVAINYVKTVGAAPAANTQTPTQSGAANSPFNGINGAATTQTQTQTQGAGTSTQQTQGQTSGGAPQQSGTTQ